MRDDARLPPDVTPLAPAALERNRMLLTGAMGFLGRELFRELLRDEALVITCLVRAPDAPSAERRVDEALQALGMEAARARVLVVAGDVAAPRFGLDAVAYADLADRIDGVLHCAAQVNWVRTYAQLRHANVEGTLEILRFACARRTKAVTFVSSLAVCFAPGAPRRVTEATDMAPWVEHMTLGYAQSKCVAESLLRQAANRGVPVTIVRPGLIAGHSETGRANPVDVVGALLKGCVERGEAPDADWLFDSVPVDYAARAIVALDRARRGLLETYHLRHARPRHWRELVLWLHLLGHSMRLVPTAEWMERVLGTSAPRSSLSPYRRFFMGSPAREGCGPRPFEIFLRGQAAISGAATTERLEALGVDEPLLDIALLRRYMDHYTAVGLLPPAPLAMGAAIARPATTESRLRRNVARSLGAGARGLDWEALPFDAGKGLLSEVASIRLGASVGIRRYRVHAAGAERNARSLDILVKAKAEDAVVHGLVAEVAGLCDPALGRELAAFPNALGLGGSHLREAALYRAPPARLEPHMPQCYGVSEDAGRGLWSVAIENLHDIETVDDAEWSAGRVEAAVDGVASIHAAWFGRESALGGEAWAAPEADREQTRAMGGLWRSLARFAEPAFSKWTGVPMGARQSDFIDDADRRRCELAAMPRTLIHNDFNPRNFAFVRRGGGLRLRVFDWELSRLGVPQHDLAELLCFVLPRDAGVNDLRTWLDRHRVRLSVGTGVAIEPQAWSRGFVMALRQFLVERLPLYTIVDRFKPQPFLPGVVRNWARLYELGMELG